MIKQTFITILLLIVSISFYGQNDWSKLSAKQKIKIAKKEQKEAKKDPEYLAMMEEALVLFQAGKYDEAKIKYQAAHDRRPDNVYPVVMLEDIEVAINLPVEEEKEIIAEEIIPEVIEEEKLPIVTPEITETTEEIQEENIEEIAGEDKVVEPEIIVLPANPEKIVPAEKPKREPERTTTRVQAQKEYLNDGVYRDSFKEGNADVEQIKIVGKGVETIYRKVSHPWGAVYYFKGEDSISKKEWEDLLIEIEKR